jgi:hypothetical protein
MSKQLHLILQGKGGVGKSLIASLLTQHFMDKDIDPVCIDTDPVNATFAGYKAFDVQRIELMDNNDIDPRAFDELIEQVMSADDDTVFVIDNGASSFLPLCAWMMENEVAEFLKAAGVQIILHSVITGGQGHGDTVLGLTNLIKHFDLPVVVWLNEFDGKPAHNGIPFENSAIVENNGDRIHALIRIAALNPKTFGYDFRNLLCHKKTFKEARADSSLNIMTRQRLIMIWRDLNQQINNANL